MPDDIPPVQQPAQTVKKSPSLRILVIGGGLILLFAVAVYLLARRQQNAQDSQTGTGDVFLTDQTFNPPAPVASGGTTPPPPTVSTGNTKAPPVHKPPVSHHRHQASGHPAAHAVGGSAGVASPAATAVLPAKDHGTVVSGGVTHATGRVIEFARKRVNERRKR